MKILLLSHTPITSTYRIGSHHLSREFALRGHSVMHVSSPVTALHLGRLHRSDVRANFRLALRDRELDGVVHVVPFLFVPQSRSSPALRRLQGRLLSWQIRRAFRRRFGGEPDVSFVDQPAFATSVAHGGLGEIVYRPTDAHFDRQQRKDEASFAKLARCVVLTSAYVREQLPAGLARLPYIIVPNGVEMAKFVQAGATGARIADAVYVGALDARFDWHAVRSMACGSPNVTISLYGPRPLHGEYEPLPSNVVLRGPVDYTRVGEVLAGHRVGLLPLNSEPVNLGRSPMKLFEYLAAGLNVVASDTPAITAMLLPGVLTYRHGADPAPIFAQALIRPVNAAGVTRAREEDWSLKSRQILDFVTKHSFGDDRSRPVRE